MDNQKSINRVVIVGGGTAGWITAALLAKLLGPVIDIELIESDAIGTVGVGEATIPPILQLNGTLGIDEYDFMRQTSATFKLGIEFNNWGGLGESYLHTFGTTGLNLGNLPFHHYWLRYHQTHPKSSYWDYSLHDRAAYRDKFAKLDKVGQTSMSGLAYAYHFDASKYALYLRRYCENIGVTRTEGEVKHVQLNSETGDIDGLTLKSGTQISGDFFVDCTGFRSLLLGQTLGVGYEDWSRWLPCDSAWAVGCEATRPLHPYTKSTAHSAGWQWRIPLQHRTGNGHVFSSAFMDDDAALKILLDNLDAEISNEPKRLKFKVGRRHSLWEKNCVAIGLASGFLEPLESTSIHLIQTHVAKLVELFPASKAMESERLEYNRQAIREFDLVRDFLILHYHKTARADSEFWNYCRNMSVPDSLIEKMELFRRAARVYKDPFDVFHITSWVQVMLGQGLMPESYHPMADRLSDRELEEFLSDVKALVDQTVDQLPSQEDFINRYCKAPMA